MRIDASAADWKELSRLSETPLAGGENLRGMTSPTLAGTTCSA